MPNRYRETSESTGRVIFLVCGFGSLKWRLSALRLARQLKKIPIPNHVITYTNSDLKRFFPSLLYSIESKYGRKSRGFGFWLWKPFIINEELKKIKDEDVLIYIDAGCEVIGNSNSISILTNYLDYVRKNHVLAMRLNASMNQYCENHIATHFKLTLDQFNSLSMVSATIIFLTGFPCSRKLLSDWINCALDNPLLLSGNKNYEGHEGFIAHRHDQSIFTALIHKNGFELFENQIDFKLSNYDLTKSYFHASRNKHIFSILPNTLFGKIIRFRWKLYTHLNKGLKQ